MKLSEHAIRFDKYSCYRQIVANRRKDYMLVRANLDDRLG